MVSTGILYGMGEKQLLRLFKQAILQQPDELTVVGDGANLIPMIHISDMCQVIEELAWNRPDDKRVYLLSDSAEITQHALVKAITDSVGNGKVKFITKEESLWNSDYNLTSLNFKIEDKPKPN